MSNNSMKPVDLQVEWDQAELETVHVCPVCAGTQARLLHENVQDWSYFSAPGRWTFWRCGNCSTVYLNPRPTLNSIGKAYKKYYTHQGASSGRQRLGLKVRWKNERLSSLFERNIEPRLHLPEFLQAFVKRKAMRMGIPFGWYELTRLKAGKLMDVGCGSGNTLALASQLGWSTHGLELDEVAVKVAQSRGLHVTQGGFERLVEFPNAFDMVVCSHVIEHVFNPMELLKLLHASLHSGGVLLLSTPNAGSDLHTHFGRYWRGLEAPRHLALFTEPTLTDALRSLGFSVETRANATLETTRESVRMARHGKHVTAQDRRVAREVNSKLIRTPQGHDFINLVATKK